MTGADEEFLKRINMKKWPIYSRTSHRKKLKEGDRIIFYLAGAPRKKFAGSAVIASDLEKENDDFTVALSEIKKWSKQILISSLLESLEFIKNKSNWGVYMQGGVVHISDKDYHVITKNTGH